jgi:radical SAM superfamily enzyme YgiQ (UPF0313 family)
MNVLLISANRNAHPAPVLPAGACLTAEAARRAGHRVRMLDLMFQRNPRRALRRALGRTAPEVVGISLRNIDNNDMQNPLFYPGELGPLIEEIRTATPAPVVLGGAAAGVMPGELLRRTGVDWVVPTEGEAVFPALLGSIEKGGSPRKIPGVAWLEGGEVRENPLATRRMPGGFSVPRYGDWVNVRAYRRSMAAAPLQTKLGCHFRCVYCTYRKLEGMSYRLMEPGAALEAVRGLRRQGFRDVEFTDNVFNFPYAHAMAVLGELARGRHEARLHSVEMNPLQMDDPLLDAMEEAGFSSIGVTAESASDRVLEGMGKGFAARDVVRAAEVVNRHRLPCLWVFLLGGPGETMETVKETFRFARQYVRPQDAAFIQAGVRIYPGTGLEAIARKEGVLTLRADDMLEPVFYCSPQVDPGWLLGAVREELSRHMNYTGSESIGLSALPLINRAAFALGMRPPLWRYSRTIRRGLGLLGVKA